jgi:hypothetical protein
LKPLTHDTLLPSVVLLLSSVLCPLLSVLCRLRSIPCLPWFNCFHLQLHSRGRARFQTCLQSSNLCHLSLCPLPSISCPLFSVVCHLSSAGCHLLYLRKTTASGV